MAGRPHGNDEVVLDLDVVPCAMPPARRFVAGLVARGSTCLDTPERCILHHPKREGPEWPRGDTPNIVGCDLATE
jgi:hypothetical protein